MQTLIAWWPSAWPLLLLVGVFVLGFALAWWLRAEDAQQYRAELKRRADRYAALAALDLDRGKDLGAAHEKIATLERGWQAVRAAVEQHTVAGK